MRHLRDRKPSKSAAAISSWACTDGTSEEENICAVPYFQPLQADELSETFE
jgi:hypothetical protein